jgi:hypothetical protein
VLAFAAGVFALTLGAEGLYHLAGAPLCESTPTTAVRCSQEGGWWALVLGGGVAGAVMALRALRHPVVRRLLFGALLLGLGLGPVWAALDDRTSSPGWVWAGSVASLLGIAVLAGLAAAALRAVRQPDPLAHPQGIAAPGAPTPPAQPQGLPPSAPLPGTTDSPPIPLAPPPGGATSVPGAGGDDPFGREPGEGADPFGRGG